MSDEFSPPSASLRGVGTPLYDLISRPLLRVSPHEAVAIAAQKLLAAGDSALLVTREDEVEGIWTESDALQSDLADPRARRRPLALVMSHSVVGLPAEATVAEARVRLERERLGHLLVFDEEGVPCGLLSPMDLFGPYREDTEPDRQRVRSALDGTDPRLTPDRRLSEAARTMAAHGRPAVVVESVEGESGLVTRQDVVRVLAEAEGDPPLADVASRPSGTVPVDASRTAAKERMREQGVRVMGVTKEDGQLAGGVGEADLMAVGETALIQQLEAALKETRARLPGGAADDRSGDREEAFQRYRALFEQSRDAVMLLDRGRFLDPNPATLRLFRVADEPVFTGYHPADLSPTWQPDGRPSAEVAQERIEEAYGRGQAFFEWRHRSVDGQEFSAEVFLSRIELADRPVLQAVVRDISGRKAMERSLQRYRAAFEQSRDAVMFLDRDSYLEGNPATLAMFGVDSREAFRTHHPADFSPPWQPDGRRSPEAAQAWIRTGFEQGKAFFEWQHRTLDGRDFPTEVLLSRIDDTEQPILQVVVRDISTRKAAEADRDQVLAILDATPDLVAIADREGRITYINRGGLLLLGEDPERTGLGARLPSWMAREKARALPHPEWARRRLEEEALPAAEQEGFWWGETALLDGEGREIPVSQVVLAHYDDAGHVPHFSTIMRDLSQQKQVEGDLRERVKELRTLRDLILLTTDDERSLQELLDACARRLPAGWLEPEGTAARIRAGGLEAVSEPFFEGGARQHAMVESVDAPVEVEVFRRGEGTGVSFLSEEQELLDSVAYQLHTALLRRKAQRELERLATHDSLTGLYNRGKLNEWLEQFREEHERYGTPLSVLMLDIDHFKQVNDHFGHQAGDQVLRELTSRVDESLRETDILGRWGGEEFLVLAPHTDEAAGAALAERLRERVANAVFSDVGPVTISLGLATLEAGETVERLEARVDEALYAAKAGGRNRYAVAEP